MFPILVTAAVLIRDGRVLITRRPEDVVYPGLWEFPGGKLEAGEPPVDAMVRELKEELGIDCVVEAAYDIVYHRYPERTVLLLAYRCRWTGGEMQPLEVADFRWVAGSELAEYPFLPADRPLVARLQRELP